MPGDEVFVRGRQAYFRNVIFAAIRDLAYMLRRIRSSTTLALLLSPVGVLLLGATRLLIVSDYNLSTALAVLSSSGYVNTLLGSVIPLVPILMPYLALLLLYLNQVIASLLTFLAALLISPMAIPRATALSTARHDWHIVLSGSWPRHTLLILLAIPFVIFLAIELAGFGIKIVTRSAGMAAFVAVLPLIAHLYPVPVTNSFYTNFVSQPWLAAETITLTTHQVVTGYVLESDQDWTVILTATDRRVVYYHTSEVSARTPCQTGEAQGQPLIPLMTNRPFLPSCDPPTRPQGPDEVRAG